MVPLTLTVEEETLTAARKKAAHQGTSVDELFRSFLDAYTGDEKQAVRFLLTLSLWSTEDRPKAPLIRFMENRFGTTCFFPRVNSRLGDRWLELCLASSYAPRNETFVIEVRHHPQEEDLERMREIHREFRHFFPSHKDQKVYGILVTVELSHEMRERALAEGIYLARADEDEKELRLDVPEDFKPRAF
jgi:hypothetical protein